MKNLEKRIKVRSNNKVL